MRWIGLFNVVYGALGLLAALYLGRPDGVALCVWVMAVGVLLRTRLPGRALPAIRALAGRLRTAARG